MSINRLNPIKIEYNKSINKQDKIKLNPASSNTLTKDVVTFSSNLPSNSNTAVQLRAELNKTTGEQGLIGKAWDGIKNLFGMKAGSNNVEKTIEKLEKGEITQEEAQEVLTKYQDGQKMCVDVVGDMISGFVALGCAMAAPVTGGASLLVAAGAGAAVKFTIKGVDCAVGGRDYKIKDFGYDLITGSINGAMAPLTNALGGVVGTGVAEICGLNAGKVIVKETGEKVIEQTVKQAGKSFLTNLLAKQGTEYVAKVGAKAGLKTTLATVAAYGADMAIDGALGGATDGFARSLADGDFENMGNNITQSFVGGLITAPIIGGGFRLAGKLGSEIGNKLFGKTTTNAVLDNTDSIVSRNTEAKAISMGDTFVREASENVADSVLDTDVKKIFDSTSEIVSITSNDIPTNRVTEDIAGVTPKIFTNNTGETLQEAVNGTIEADLLPSKNSATNACCQPTEQKQHLIELAKTLDLEGVKYSTDEFGFEALNINDTRYNGLSAQDKKNLYNLIKTAELIRANADIESFPLIIGYDQIKLLELYIKQNPRIDNNELFQQVVDRNLHYTKLAYQSAQLIYDTPLDAEKALSNTNGYIKVYDVNRSPDEIQKYAKQLMMQGYSVYDSIQEAYSNCRRIPVIDLSQIANEEDVSRFGFPVGTKKKDLRFYVYMIDDDGPFRTNILQQNLDRILQDMELNNKIWSKSLLSPDYQNTFMGRHYGFITEPEIGNMYSIRTDGSLTGYDKTKTLTLKSIFNTDDAYEAETLTRLPNAIRQQLGISESGYVELVKKLQQIGNIFNTNTPEYIEIDGKQISFAKIKEAISNTQDKLFDTIITSNNSENNEILDEMLKIKAMFIKSTEGYKPHYEKSVEDNNAYIVEFIKKFKEKTGKDLPIVIL